MRMIEIFFSYITMVDNIYIYWILAIQIALHKYNTTVFSCSFHIFKNAVTKHVLIN